MGTKHVVFLVSIVFIFLGCEAPAQQSLISDSPLPILEVEQTKPVTVGDIPLPEGFKRIALLEADFGTYLRNIALNHHDHVVHLFNGQPKANQRAHMYILDIDVGSRDLQQCADAVMRLRAEYLYEKNFYDDIAFNFTSGDKIPYSRYARGGRVRVIGNEIQWKNIATEDFTYPTFRKYLNVIFAYAGSYSLSRELNPVNQLQDIIPGDIFIQGGFPGHAVIVMDVAVNDQGEKMFMLAQSYMPAQEIHILVNPSEPGLSPWYPIEFTGSLRTPEWTFERSDLKRWPSR